MQLDEFTVTDPTPRRPSCNNLYDVFRNIHDDEVEHEQTMQSCQVSQCCLHRLLTRQGGKPMHAVTICAVHRSGDACQARGFSLTCFGAVAR